jgi:DNA-binding Lrp family transcriptional regulator
MNAEREKTACPDFSRQELAVLRAVQGDLPASLTPFADIAARAGLDEAQALALLVRLRADGTIRRFGATLRHQRSGWIANVMVAWAVPDEQADACGATAAAHRRVSHCYLRPSPARDWPYTLYTMIHGRSRKECLATVAELRRRGLPPDYALLDSLRELKKTSMRYF